MRAMTLRLDAEQTEGLDLAQRVLGVPTAELVRTAVGEYLDGLAADPAFRAEVEAVTARERALLARLRPERPG